MCLITHFSNIIYELHKERLNIIISNNWEIITILNWSKSNFARNNFL